MFKYVAISCCFFYTTVETPIRIKRIIVEKHEITERWKEEISLLKKEMANFVSFYMDVTIPRLTNSAEELQAKING